MNMDNLRNPLEALNFNFLDAPDLNFGFILFLLNV